MLDYNTLDDSPLIELLEGIEQTAEFMIKSPPLNVMAIVSHRVWDTRIILKKPILVS